MGVISVSIDDQLLKIVDRFADENGFQGRSELVRTALRSLIEQSRGIESLDGVTDAIILVKYRDKHSDTVSDILHHHRSLITSQLHNHLETDACIEILVVNGDAADIKHLWRQLQTSRETQYTDIVTP